MISFIYLPLPPPTYTFFMALLRFRLDHRALTNSPLLTHLFSSSSSKPKPDSSDLRHQPTTTPPGHTDVKVSMRAVGGGRSERVVILVKMEESEAQPRLGELRRDPYETLRQQFLSLRVGEDKKDTKHEMKMGQTPDSMMKKPPKKEGLVEKVSSSSKGDGCSEKVVKMEESEAQPRPGKLNYYEDLRQGLLNLRFEEDKKDTKHKIKMGQTRDSMMKKPPKKEGLVEKVSSSGKGGGPSERVVKMEESEAQPRLGELRRDPYETLRQQFLSLRVGEDKKDTKHKMKMGQTHDSMMKKPPKKEGLVEKVSSSSKGDGWSEKVVKMEESEARPRPGVVTYEDLRQTVLNLRVWEEKKDTKHKMKMGQNRDSMMKKPPKKEGLVEKKNVPSAAKKLKGKVRDESEAPIKKKEGLPRLSDRERADLKQGLLSEELQEEKEKEDPFTGLSKLRQLFDTRGSS